MVQSRQQKPDLCLLKTFLLGGTRLILSCLIKKVIGRITIDKSFNIYLYIQHIS